jgi:methionyl aminopeptidase
MRVQLKTPAQLARMREAGAIVRSVLDAVAAACGPGMTTAELDEIAARELARSGARSAFQGHGSGDSRFPAVLCTSINDVVVNGVPRRDAMLWEGDLVGVSFACFKDDLCASAARTIAVGAISAPARGLLDTARECLARAIRVCGPGTRLGDLGAAIQELAESRGYGVVRDFVGHGIGRALFEDPQVPSFGRAGDGVRLRPGLTITIAPMLTAGGTAVRPLDDGWAVATADGSLSAHFEHTIEVTEHGATVLTA